MKHESAGLPHPIFYFGYGSNLWLEQMRKRCPTSNYAGIAHLPGYQWIINERGYANVFQTDGPDDYVYGLAYLLESADEAALDENEGVPWAYQKMWLRLDFWPVPIDKEDKFVDVADTTRCTSRIMLVYVDPIRVHGDAPWPEYVYRMNRGIDDALALGVPKPYVDAVLRKYIKPETGKEDKEVKRNAEQQAQRFIDEN